MPEVTEEKTEDEIVSRLDELSRKEDKTDTEKLEFKALTGDLDKVKTKGKIDSLVNQNTEYKQKLSRLERELEEERKRREEIAERRETPPPVRQETIKVSNKSYYTDDSLRSMLVNKTITQEEADRHYQERERALAAEEAYKRLKQDQEEERKTQKMKEDVDFVFKKYPKWDTNNPGHDPDDPVYQRANKFYKAGMNIRAAMEAAEEFFEKKDVTVDRSDDLGVRSPSAPERKSKDKEVSVTEDVRELAVRFYRDQYNPLTGRPYTENEAIEKYKKSMMGRKK